MSGAGPDRFNASLGTCEVCGKRCYESRRAARRAAHAIFPTQKVSAYRCGNFYHFGHLPKIVNDGTMSRADVRLERYGR